MKRDKSKKKVEEVYCEDCHNTCNYYSLKIKTKKIKKDRYKMYFNCPNCKKEYIILYLDEAIKSLREEIKKKVIKDGAGSNEVRDLLEELKIEGQRVNLLIQKELEDELKQKNKLVHPE